MENLLLCVAIVCLINTVPVFSADEDPRMDSFILKLKDYVNIIQEQGALIAECKDTIERMQAFNKSGYSLCRVCLSAFFNPVHEL